MKVSLLALFRDSGDGIYKSLKLLEELERHSSDVEFEYFFYENDSKDKTPEILSDWLRDREGGLLSEELNRPKFASICSRERFELMSDYRNRLLEFSKPLSSDYTFVWDSDVVFEPNILEQYLQIEYEDWVLLAPDIRQDTPCLMGGNTQDSYYDTIALRDMEGIWALASSDCPFIHQRDRDKWKNKEAIEVNAAFGGLVLVRTSAIENSFWGTKGEVEHIEWQKHLKKCGKIYLMPNIETSVTLPEGTRKDCKARRGSFKNLNEIIEAQKRCLSKTHWERWMAIEKTSGTRGGTRSFWIAVSNNL